VKIFPFLLLYFRFFPPIWSLLSRAPRATQLDIRHALTRHLAIIPNLAKMMELLEHYMLGNLQLLRSLATALRESSKVLTITFLRWNISFCYYCI
jgi:hypothetical protein